MSSEEVENSSCPQCGADVPDGAPNGLCPVCLMAGAMVPTSDGEPNAEKPELPDIEEVREAFPQLEVFEVIGVGGMGLVYRQECLCHIKFQILPKRRSRESEVW